MKPLDDLRQISEGLGGSDKDPFVTDVLALRRVRCGLTLAL